MKKKYMSKKRKILREILDDMTLWEMADLLVDNLELMNQLERLASDYVSRTIDDTSVSNIIADEIGYAEYVRRAKEVEG